MKYGWNNVQMGGFRSEPTAEHECKEAVWTHGASCKSCQIECYRRGWGWCRATADNRKRVSEKLCVEAPTVREK